MIFQFNNLLFLCVFLDLQAFFCIISSKVYNFAYFGA